MSYLIRCLVAAIASLAFTLGSCGAAGAAEITVSTTIQAAIDAAAAGDVIIVPAGTYHETIDFKGKVITVRSANPADPAVVAATIIDGGLIGRAAVTFASGEGPDSVLSALTITRGGSSFWDDMGPYISPGGGIYCFQSSPTITGNVIAENETGGAGDGNGAGILCDGGAASIEGNRIEDNLAYNDGAGVHCRTSAATIRHNSITGNLTYEGGGAGVTAGSGVVEGNTISGNSADSFVGGGIIAGSGDITGNLICGNTSVGGGGIWCTTSANIVNNTIAGNYVGMDMLGGGISVGGGAPVIRNCIFWGNNTTSGTARDYYLTGGTTTVAYSNIGDGAVDGGKIIWGPGRLNSDPLFAGNGDCHLRSVAGRWDPAADGGAGAWVTDIVSSPCIDAGDPKSQYSNEPGPNGRRINMGAYGNTDEASKSARTGTIRINTNIVSAGWTVTKSTGETIAGEGPAHYKVAPGKYTLTWTAMDGSVWPWDVYDTPSPASITRKVAARGLARFRGVYRVCRPSLDPAPGTYAAGVSISISCGTPNAVIHYTTNGRVPTVRSPVYTAPISVTSKRTIKAIAMPPERGPAMSRIVKGTYKITAP
jgi:hypothetical protein